MGQLVVNHIQLYKGPIFPMRKTLALGKPPPLKGPCLEVMPFFDQTGKVTKTFFHFCNGPFELKDSQMVSSKKHNLLSRGIQMLSSSIKCYSSLFSKCTFILWNFRIVCSSPETPQIAPS